MFMWNQHDGRSFGSQKITDADLGLRTDFVSFGASSWMARFYLQRPNWPQEQAVILYFALQDTVSSLNASSVKPTPSGEIHLLDGQSAAVQGKFSLNVRPVVAADVGNWSLSVMRTHGEPFVDMAKVAELIKGGLIVQPDGNFIFKDSASQQQTDVNFVALQINVKSINKLE